VTTSPKAPKKKLTTLQRDRLMVVISPLVVILLWEFCSRTNLVDRRILAPPTVIVATIVQLVQSGNLLGQAGATLSRFFVGFIVGTIPGTLIGLAMGVSPWTRSIVQPLVAAFYPLPRIALFPIILILVGLNETSNVILISLGPLFTMIITTMAAVLNVEPIYKEVAQSFGARQRDMYFDVMFPAALPVIMGGIKLSVGQALLNTVAVEFLVADNGIGHLIWNSWTTLSISQSVAGLVTAGVIGSTLFTITGAIEKKVIPWVPER
jgi:ABC-type nitrate/sulfonate/bicarbonate transport system permease component